MDDVVAEVAALQTPLVLVTGGEPLLQSDCLPLMTALCDAGHEVLLETGGSLDVAEVDPRVCRVVDLKCPGSGEEARNRWENLPLLGAGDEIKLVVRDEADFRWALGKLPDLPTAPTLLWSPVHDVCPPADLARWLLDSGAPGRLQLQLHKLIWPDADGGV